MLTKFSPFIVEVMAILETMPELRVTPSVPPGRKVVLPDAERTVIDRGRDGTSSLGLFIDYVDRNGVATSRRIVCRSYDSSAKTIVAWCFEREALREFRIDRIEAAACTETGEMFDLPMLVASLKQRGLPTHDAGLKVALRLLTFLMRCDGVHHKEEAYLEEAVVSYAVRFDGDDSLVRDGLRLAATLAPDSWDFHRAMRCLAHRRDGPRLARFVQHWGGAVIDADGWHSEPEARFGAELGAALSQIAARG